MKSSIIWGQTTHKRFGEGAHFFSYPLYMIDVDLDDILANRPLGLSMNQWGVFSLHDTDFLGAGSGSIRDKCQTILNQLDRSWDAHRIQLLTIPRYFMKVFRPVSFYLVYDQADTLRGALAEVTNTYKETIYYASDFGSQNTEKSDSNTLTFSVDKTFHVSPFYDEEGEYYFKIVNNDHKTSVVIDYLKHEKKVFSATFSGRKKSLTTWNLIVTAAYYPLTALLSLPRIYWQAYQLYYKKKHPARSKPMLKGDHVIQTMPMTWLQTRVWKKLTRHLNQTSWGCITFILPDDSRHSFGDSESDHSAIVQIHHQWFFNQIALNGEIGFGEAYMKGFWSSPNIADVVEFFIQNKPHFESLMTGNIVSRFLQKRFHASKKNTKLMSKQNIEDHYDLGNRFYQLFLDSSMMYSSAVYPSDNATLDDAQAHKIDRLVDKLQCESNHHVLEIGSGWGSVAIALAKRSGCQVTTLTLSDEQYEYVQRRIESENLEDQVTVLLKDYRDMTGQFDRIISVEMIEAVGYDYLNGYFKQVSDLLCQGGRFVLQAITYPDEAYDTYKSGSDFIRRHIFPGGHLPSLAHMASIVRDVTELKLDVSENIALSYARTLADWHHRFDDKLDHVKALGFSESFIRKWKYYFSFCEAAFKSQFLGTYQQVYVKESAS